MRGDVVTTLRTDYLATRTHSDFDFIASTRCSFKTINYFFFGRV
jgi:hypothetical protein